MTSDLLDMSSKKEGCTVFLTDEVYQVCISHALMTEHEEVMGLLLGSADGKDVRIWASLTLERSDKRKDRCEISPEQLVAAAEMAEKMTKELGIETRVVGWYHSHPHITCLPSHVDLRTQLQYQHMDQHFIGLIFAVFNSDPRTGRMRHELMAFQADSNSQRIQLQPRVVPPNMLLSQDTLEKRSRAESLRGLWGHHSLSSPAEQSFAEIHEKFRQQLESLGEDGYDVLAWMEYASRHIQQLNALLARELVPLQNHFDAAAANAQVLEGMYRAHNEWARKQPPSMLATSSPRPEAAAASKRPAEPAHELSDGSSLADMLAVCKAGEGSNSNAMEVEVAASAEDPPTEGPPTPPFGGFRGGNVLTVGEESQEVRSDAETPPRENDMVGAIVALAAVEHVAPASSANARDKFCAGRRPCGERCKMRVKDGETFCIRHKKQEAKKEAEQSKKKRARLEPNQSNQRVHKSWATFGDIIVDDARQVLIARPVPDEERTADFRPHPNSVNGCAPPREYSLSDPGDEEAASEKAQCYLYGI